MVMFYDNDTKINGICGDLWQLLEDYLNFTYVHLIAHACLKCYIYSVREQRGLLIMSQSIIFLRFIPIKSTDRNFGDKLENGSESGLVGMLARNEAQVILRSGFYPSQLDNVDYTMPLWKSK